MIVVLQCQQVRACNLPASLLLECPCSLHKYQELPHTHRNKCCSHDCVLQCRSVLNLTAGSYNSRNTTSKTRHWNKGIFGKTEFAGEDSVTDKYMPWPCCGTQRSGRQGNNIVAETRGSASTSNNTVKSSPTAMQRRLQLRNPALPENNLLTESMFVNLLQ